MTVAELADEATVRKDPVRTRALIIGTGFSGLGMAIALQRQGVDFLILEKADEIGGTWRDNTYPGCACDIPSHMYSFSFEPKPDWTAHVVVPARDLRLPQGRHRQVRAAPLRRGSTRGSTARTGTTTSWPGMCSPTPGASTSRSS